MSKDQVEKSVETEDQKAAREYANDECFLEGTPVWRDKHEAFLAGCRTVRAKYAAIEEDLQKALTVSRASAREVREYRREFPDAGMIEAKMAVEKKKANLLAETLQKQCESNVSLIEERDAYREALEVVSVEADPEIRCKQSRLEELRSYAEDILGKFKKEST